MLKHFHAYPLHHESYAPYSYALLCIGKTPSAAVAYAWVDTIQIDGHVSYTKLVHSTEISHAKICETLNTLCGTDHPMNEPELFHRSLYQYMVDMANKKLETREKWYKSQNRQYKATKFATFDAAWAQFPLFPQAELNKQLLSEREGIPFSHLRTVDVFNTSDETLKKKRWAWKDYVEPTKHVATLLKHTAGEIIPGKPLSAESIKHVNKYLNKSSLRTPRSRLTALIQHAKNIPHAHTVPAAIPWVESTPGPLTERDAESVAKLPHEEIMQLLAEHQSWLTQYAIMKTSVGTLSRVADYVYQYEYNADEDEIVPVPWDIDLKQWIQQEMNK